ncbi:hypothetical protein LCGC14_0527340 [marine sediment metagenome]|uniref:Uncharacterized protein n=1 Tax=marine sediment metagenome TaxID=412755 RepID=A0A0F9V4T2_9ZZZZ
MTCCHDWYAVSGFVPYDLTNPSTVTLACHSCFEQKVVEKWEEENEVIGAIEDLCRIRNVLRGKS